MVPTIGAIFPYAIGVTLSPFPLIAALLLLLSPAGRTAGAAFLATRVATVAIVVTAVSLLAELLPESSGSSRVGAIVRLVIGIALMVWALLTWIRRPGPGDEPDTPAWMTSIQTMTVSGAARFGLLLSIANIKELAFGIGAGLTIASAELGVASDVVVVVIYAVLANLSVAIPVTAFWCAPDRVRAPLESARNWLVRNNSVVMAAVLLIIGAILVGNGLSGF